MYWRISDRKGEERRERAEGEEYYEATWFPVLGDSTSNQHVR